jgi:hypothetical protein
MIDTQEHAGYCSNPAVSSLNVIPSPQRAHARSLARNRAVAFRAALVGAGIMCAYLWYTVSTVSPVRAAMSVTETPAARHPTVIGHRDSRKKAVTHVWLVGL